MLSFSVPVISFIRPPPKSQIIRQAKADHKTSITSTFLSVSLILSGRLAPRFCPANTEFAIASVHTGSRSVSRIRLDAVNAAMAASPSMLFALWNIMVPKSTRLSTRAMAIPVESKSRKSSPGTRKSSFLGSILQ